MDKLKTPLGFFLAGGVITLLGLALILANPAAVLSLLDFDGRATRQHEATVLEQGSTEKLGLIELQALYDEHRAGVKTAAQSIAAQDKRYGLPPEFIDQLIVHLGERSYSQNAAQMVASLARHREFDSAMETALVESMSLYPYRKAHLEALGYIGAKRPLTDVSLEALMQQAAEPKHGYRDALQPLATIAAARGLSPARLDRIATIALTPTEHKEHERAAVRVLLAAGAHPQLDLVVDGSDSWQVRELAMQGQSAERQLETFQDAFRPAAARSSALSAYLDDGKNTSPEAIAALEYCFTDGAAICSRVAFGYTSSYRAYVPMLDVEWERILVPALRNGSAADKSAADTIFTSEQLDPVVRDHIIASDITAGPDSGELGLRLAHRTRANLGPMTRTAVEDALASAQGEQRQYIEYILEPPEEKRPSRDKPRISWKAFGFYAWVASALVLVGGFGGYFAGRFLQALITPQPGLLGRFLFLLVWVGLTLAVMFVVGVAALGEDDSPFYLVVIGVYGMLSWFLHWSSQRITRSIA
ncbi:MAG: hypothetical protein ACR2PZ_21860 [Pseudomonadales bacterium]